MSTPENHQRYARLKQKQLLPLKIEDQIDYMERTVRQDKKQKSSFLACYSAKKNTVDPEFIRAFETLSKDEQTSLFKLYVESLDKYFEGQPLKQPIELQDKYLFSVQVRQGTLRKSWTAHRVEIDSRTLRVGMAGSDRYDMDLHEYLIRKSKATDKVCFVLESAKKNVRKTLRIGFDTRGDFDKCYNIVHALVRRGQLENLDQFLRTYEEMKRSNDKGFRREGRTVRPNTEKEPTHQEESTKNKRQLQLEEVSEHEQIVQTIASELVDGEEKGDIIGEIIEQNDLVEKMRESQLDNNGKKGSSSMPELNLESLDRYEIPKAQAVERKKCLDIFHKLMPDYQLDQLEDQANFRIVKNSGRFRILQANQPLLHKVSGTVAFKLEDTLAALLDCHRYKLWNEEIQLADIKIRIISENSAIVYQKHKPYSKFYKARDFLYLRHVFAQGDHYYIIDKSIENSHYPPFSNIIRGTIKYCLWGLHAKGTETVITVACELLHQGFLTAEQNQSLTIRYLSSIANIDEFLRQNSTSKLKIDQCFDLNWDISRNTLNNTSQRRRRSGSKTVTIKDDHSLSQFDGDLSQIDSERFYTAHGLEDGKWDGVSLMDFQQLDEDSGESPKEVREISEPSEEDPNIDKLIGCQLDSEGYAILPRTYLSKRHKFLAVESDYKPVHNPNFPHQIWRDEWKPVAENGLFYINKKKIEVQKGIFKYVISKLGKNLLSGKGILSVSLPVDIFGAESNLERTARLMSFGPLYFDRACRTTDPVERFKYMFCFSIGIALVGLEMDKPFNPILGETYQGWMNGCPVFLEQISHHPPIAAFIFQGRGWKVYGSIESRMEISINSGCGINHGEFIVEFEDTHQKIRLRTPGGQISGLTFGDRIFNFVGRGICYDYENNIFAELVYNPTKKGFFSIGKQQKEADYIAGKIIRVTEDFLDDFRRSQSKKESPQPKHIIDVASHIEGRWTQGLFFDGVEYLNVDRDVPCILEPEKHPLNSNSCYREDLIYLRKKDLARSQVEKERLQNVQRGDRKLREKFHKNKH